MLEHFKGDEIFVKKIQDYLRQVESGRIIVTKFLNPHEINIVKSVIGNNANIGIYGGFKNSELNRVVIAPFYIDINNDDYKIEVYKVVYNEKFDTLAHRDVLGALMNMGIKRDMIGDICKEPLSFAISKENSDYVLLNLTKIKRASITLKKIDEELEIKQNFKEKEVVISSLRLDRVIGTLFGLSRAKSNEYIKAGYIKVNYKIIEQIDYLCNNNDIISFKKKGRVKLVTLDKKTKSNNQVVKGLFYL